jgi:hypothetical protein
MFDGYLNHKHYSRYIDVAESLYETYDFEY